MQQDGLVPKQSLTLAQILQVHMSELSAPRFKTGFDVGRLEHQHLRLEQKRVGVEHGRAGVTTVAQEEILHPGRDVNAFTPQTGDLGRLESFELGRQACSPAP